MLLLHHHSTTFIIRGSSGKSGGGGGSNSSSNSNSTNTHLRLILIDTHTRCPPDVAFLIYQTAAATALALGGQTASTVGVALAQTLAGPEIGALGRREGVKGDICAVAGCCGGA